MKVEIVKSVFTEFMKSYDAQVKDQIWAEHSRRFRAFWVQKIVAGNLLALTETEIDEIIKILDRNGKGNTKQSEAVARAMIPQGAWRRMFQELCLNNQLASVITSIFEESDLQKKADNIDTLYRMNEGRKNNLTGQSGNAINAMLGAYDPVNNLTIISLKDRLSIFDYFGFPSIPDFERLSIGTRFVKTNQFLLSNFAAIGVSGSSRTVSCFCYHPPVKALWKDELIVTTQTKTVGVTVPQDTGVEEDEDLDEDGPRESIVMQALVAEIGAKMGLSIWLPKSDRSRVLQKWNAPSGVLLESLPLNYGDTIMKTIENIDVLWLNKRTIVRAFEVEHTTSIYSGLLRMADLLALIPNIDIDLHIVAPSSRREKVFEEIRRPVFSLLEGGALSDRCTFVSYDNLIELAGDKNLGFLKNEVLDKYSEAAE